MKIVRIILALVISLAMLYIAHSNSRGRPVQYVHTDGGYSFEMVSVPKVIEHQSDRITVKVTGLQEGDRVAFKTSQLTHASADKMAEFMPMPMATTPGTEGEFYFEITAGDKGGRFYYYFEVMDATGAAQAKFAAEDGSAFFLRYIGEVPPAVLIGHIFFIFATVFFVAMAAVQAFGVISGNGDVYPMARSLFFATVACFIGGYPLGIPMNWFAFGGTWEGVPFGTDATDNKTQLLFVYLIFASLSTFGSLSRGKLGRDLFGPTTLGWIGLGAFAVMLFIYLIPHSIQFAPTFTYAFCYTWIAIIAAGYLLGRMKSARTA